MCIFCHLPLQGRKKNSFHIVRTGVRCEVIFQRKRVNQSKHVKAYRRGFGDLPSLDTFGWMSGSDGKSCYIGFDVSTNSRFALRMFVFAGLETGLRHRILRPDFLRMSSSSAVLALAANIMPQHLILIPPARPPSRSSWTGSCTHIWCFGAAGAPRVPPSPVHAVPALSLGLLGRRGGEGARRGGLGWRPGGPAPSSTGSSLTGSVDPVQLDRRKTD